MKEYNFVREISARAYEVAPDLQPWPGYYDSKAREFETIRRFCGFKGGGSAVEIGCGNAFTSVLLSSVMKKVYAFDLPSADPKSHSLGINVALELVRRLGIRSVEVAAASMETLPLNDGSVDLVFSEYTLQYIIDKNKALGEVRRVLYDGGTMVIVVPNFTERLITPVMKYKYLMRRSLEILADRIGQKKPEAAPSHAYCTAAHDPARKTRTLADYLLLRPDGAYDSFMEEMMRHTPGSWKRLLEKNGFKVTGTFSTQILPLGLFDILGASAGSFISKNMHYVNNRIGNKPFIRGIGYSIGFAARKI